MEYEKVKSQVSSFDQEKAGFLAELQKKSARVMELENLLPLYGVEESEDKSQPITPEDRIKKLEYLLVESR